jgi:hypothetical protein
MRNQHKRMKQTRTAAILSSTMRLISVKQIRIAALIVVAVAAAGCNSASVDSDNAIGRAFNSRTSDIQVEGEGVVSRILSDDLNGSRHQRFIVRLGTGQTVLITHNIDLAPRIDGLREGDTVAFNGEYVWNAEGGVIHWTHHDPQGRHVSGWIKHKGRTYQ